MAASVIDEKELAQRVAILKRFRELLIRQRDRFRNYLTVLDKQQAVIGSGSANDVLAYVELEENIAADIFAMQKVIDPLELMYREAVPDFSADDVPAIKATLENLRKQSAAQSNHNRELISGRMDIIRREIKDIKSNPFVQAGSVYREINTAPVVDIRG
jgi:hypothetical protein